MNLVFEKLSQIVAPGQQIKQEIQGNFMRIAESQYPVTIEILSQNRIIGRMANMQAGDYVRDVEFDGIIINNGNNQQQITIQICGGGVGSDRVLGEVSVVDGGKFRTIANSSFSGRYAMGAVAGVLNHMQLYNPLASGKVLYVEQIIASVGTSAGVNIYLSSSALTSVYGNPPSKKSGGVDSSAEIRFQTNAAYPFINVPLAGMYLPGGTGQTFAPKEPYAVLPGYGLNAVCQEVNDALNITFEFYEEATQ